MLISGRVLHCVVVVFAVGVSRAAPISPSVVDSAQEDDATSRPPEVLNAIEAFNENKVADAFSLLQVAAQRYPHLPPARVMLANLYFTSNQAAAGRLQLERMVAEDPRDPEAYLIFGDMLGRQGFVTAAAALYAQAEPLANEFQKDQTRRNHLLVRLYSGLTTVAETRRQWPEAHARLEQWLEVDPDNAVARGRMGRALFFMDRPEEAFAQFEAAANSDSSQAAHPPQIAMLMLYHAQGDQQRAADWQARAIQKSPDDLATRLGVARWFWETGQVDQADVHAKAALAIDPESFHANFYCGLVARHARRLAEAERFLQAAYENSPGDNTARNQLALVLAEQADATKQRRGLQLATVAARADPQNSDAAATLAWVLHRLGRTPEAAQTLKDSLAGQRTLSRDSAFHVAQVLFRLGYQQQARQLLQTALDRSGPFVAEKVAQAWQDQIKGTPQ